MDDACHSRVVKNDCIISVDEFNVDKHLLFPIEIHQTDKKYLPKIYAAKKFKLTTLNVGTFFLSKT